MSKNTKMTEVDNVYKKIAWHTVPLLMLCYIVSYLDRVNIGFAKLQMSGDLNLDNAAFALGASIFFWGYMLFEFPSNLLLQRLGAQFWIARIMISWGIVSGMIAFTGQIAGFLGFQNSTVFYTLRLLLGICEAGFFPGVVFYINQWFPVHRQGRIFSNFLLALPTSLIIGGPLSGALLYALHGWMGLQGWQWMIVIEALPALILGTVVLMRLSSTPETASFLTDDEREIVLSGLAVKDDKKLKHISQAISDFRVWTLVGILLTFNTGFYGLSFWLPTIIQKSGVEDPLTIGLLSAIPFIAGAMAMLFNAAHSKRTGERRYHIIIPGLMGGLGLILSAASSSSIVLSIFFLAIGAAGILGLMPVFWTLPGTILTGTAAAAGIAVINMLGSLSGITGAFVSSVMGTLTGDVNNGTYILGLSLWLSAVLVLFLPKKLFNQ